MGGKVHKKQRRVIVSLTHKQVKYKKRKDLQGERYRICSGKERKCLKPRIEQARKVGKGSCFCGPFGYIEGQFGIDGRKCLFFEK